MALPVKKLNQILNYKYFSGGEIEIGISGPELDDEKVYITVFDYLQFIGETPSDFDTYNLGKELSKLSKYYKTCKYKNQDFTIRKYDYELLEKNEKLILSYLRGKLKLHEAIKLVLKEAELPQTASEIANAINERSLYSRKDGLPIPISQIHARVKNYYNYFEKINDRITLVTKRQRGVLPNDFELLVNKIWDVTKLFQGTIPRNKYYIILLFISLKKDGLLANLKTLSDYSKGLKNETIYKDVIHYFLPILNKLSGKNKYSEICKEINQIEIAASTNIFPDLFDELARKSESDSKDGIATLSNAKELDELIHILCEPVEEKSIYAPLEGTIPALKNWQKSKVTANTSNEESWAIGKLRLKAHNAQNQIEYNYTNPTEKLSNNNQYDIIILNPTPFQSIYSSVTDSLIEQLEKLKSGGKLIAILPTAFLYQKGKLGEIRERLIELNSIETVIQLPENILNSTQSNAHACVVFSNQKKENKLIRIINASSFYTKGYRNQVSLKINYLKEQLLNLDTTKFNRNLSIEEVKENNYILSPSRYLISNFNGKELGEFITPIHFEYTKNNEGKLITIDEFNKDEFNDNLRAKQIKNVPIRQMAKMVDQSCLIITLNNHLNLKATYFTYEDEPIFITKNIYAFEIDEQAIDQDTIINTINNSENINIQAAHFILGNEVARPYIREKDLLKIKVTTHKNNEVEEVSTPPETNNQSALEEEIIDAAKKEIYEEFSSLKHSTGTPRQNILSNSKILIRFFQNEESNAFKELNEKFEKRYDIDLLNLVSHIKSDVNHISKMFDIGQGGIILSDYEKFDIPVSEVARHFKKLIDHNYKFKIIKSFTDKTIANPESEEKYFLEKFYEDSEKSILEKTNVCITGHMTLLEILVDNILSNTNKHGFDEESEYNKLNIEFIYQNDYLKIKIQNNGKPFPKGFDKSKFIAKFSTANREIGTGLGGYDINRIAKYFGNEDWKLNLSEDSEFSVSFEFNFKLNFLAND